MAEPVLAPFGIMAFLAAPPALAADMRFGPEALPIILPPLLQEEPFISFPFGFTADTHSTGRCSRCGVRFALAHSLGALIAAAFTALVTRPLAALVPAFRLLVCHQ
jgi:hypothetical protein